MIEIEDEEFLSQVAAAEAEAISSTATKRRKTSQFTTTTTITTPTAVTAQKQNDVVQEGAYLAALKGSKSQLFHQMTSNPRNNIINNKNNNNAIKSINSNFNSNVSYDNNRDGISGGTSCYKCGKLGHWARDCGATGNDDVADKECPCKIGYCNVITSKTEKNPGRKFYRCPVKQEDGGCGFFEWCDSRSGTDGITFRSQTNAVNHSVPELPCPCGAGSCLILTTKSGKNIGQQFYKCPAVQGSCGFFKWCNDQSVTASVTSSINSSQTYQNTSNMNNKSYNATNFVCFKCGKEGHWAKDCQQLSSRSPAYKIVKDPGTCFICGKPGHWARDCPSSETKPRFGQ